MNNAWKPAIVACSFLAWLSACGSNGSAPNPPPDQSSKWAWISGSNAVNHAGTYGTRGTAAASNVPGARYSAVSWIDSAGNLWLFGGVGYDSMGFGGYLNDLWKYSPAADEWTWTSGSNTANQAGNYGTQGITDPANVPGGRSGAVSWLDSYGNLWLFGGLGRDSIGNQGQLSDLWKHNPTTHEWTWVSGSNTGDQAGIYGIQGVADPSNLPGARESALSWIDSDGNLWLFGGTDKSIFSQFNDMWKYDPKANEWIWVSGSNTTNQWGVYGAKGTAAPLNSPGARESAVSWIDSAGNLWLFGGLGRDSLGNNNYLNDLWKYNPTTNEWTWVSGSDTVNQLGTYGAQGIAASSNVPGARQLAVSWSDPGGKLWLFGGLRYKSPYSPDASNDLWKYDPATNKWTWVSGSSATGQGGTYGTRGIAAAANVPGARQAPALWVDSGGKLWLFGGYGDDSVDYPGYLNDLWRYSR